jgi:outer membrane murein-binding lipoprotein Lpp
LDQASQIHKGNVATARRTDAAGAFVADLAAGSRRAHASARWHWNNETKGQRMKHSTWKKFKQLRDKLDALATKVDELATKVDALTTMVAALVDEGSDRTAAKELAAGIATQAAALRDAIPK